MEDVFKFLLVAAVIATGLIRQFKKETNKNADKSPGIPMPDVDNPLPENWGGGIYGGFIPEGPKPTNKPKTVSKPSAKSKYTSIKASPPPPHPIRRSPTKQHPNTASTRQRKRGKPLSGQRYFNGNIKTADNGELMTEKL